MRMLNVILHAKHAIISEDNDNNNIVYGRVFEPFVEQKTGMAKGTNELAIGPLLEIAHFCKSFK